MTYTITGTGNQAPYGIGEIISTHRTLNAACRAARRWYNRPAVRDEDGTRYCPDTMDVRVYD
jgi:hypothetical protein